MQKRRLLQAGGLTALLVRTAGAGVAWRRPGLTQGRLGRRAFLHPEMASAAPFDDRAEGWSDAPQTLYADHFLEAAPTDAPIGCKLEAPPRLSVYGLAASRATQLAGQLTGRDVRLAA